MLKFDILLEKPKNKILWILFVLNFILFIIFMGVIFPSYFAQFPPGYGFLEMKNLWTKSKMEEMIGVWNATSPDLLELMIIIHVWDFFFMANYGLLIASGILLVARGFNDSEKLQKFYLVVFNFSWIAVLLDVIEGINLYIIFFNPLNINEINVFSANFSALLCVFFFYGGLLLMIFGFIIILLKNRKK